MTAMIDTLKFAKNFETAGFAKPQAEALTAAMAEMNGITREDLATKNDLAGAVVELKGNFSRAALRSDIDSLATDLRGEMRLSRAEAKTDLKVAVAEIKTDMITLNATTRSQILWTLLGTQFFVIGAFAILSNLNKFFS